MKKIASLWLLLSTFSFASAQFSAGDSIPVRLNYIDGERNGSNNQISWAVTCFLQYAKFDIQRSQDGVSFHTIYSFQADEPRCLQPFSYADMQPAERAFYRVRVGDLDGRYYSSKTVAVYGQTKGFDITGITPSIIIDEATIHLSSSSPVKVEIIITTISGSVIKKFPYTLHKGNNAIPVQLNTLQKGIYFISAGNSERGMSSVRIIKD